MNELELRLRDVQERLAVVEGELSRVESILDELGRTIDDERVAATAARKIQKAAGLDAALLHLDAAREKLHGRA